MKRKLYKKPVIKNVRLMGDCVLIQESTKEGVFDASREQQSVRFDWDDENEE